MAKSEIEIRMEQESCIEAINEAIREVEAQLNELGDVGSEALDSGDQALIDQVMESICFINDQLASLKALKVNTKMQVITSHISSTMVGVLNTVGRTAGSVTAPNAKKLAKIQKQLAINTATTKQARKDISNIMRGANPASKTSLSPEQKAQAMMFIQSRHVSRTGSLSAGTDLWDKVNAEKNTQL